MKPTMTFLTTSPLETDVSSDRECVYLKEDKECVPEGEGRPYSPERKATDPGDTGCGQLDSKPTALCQGDR